MRSLVDLSANDTSEFVPEDSVAVLEHGVVRDAGAQHAVPRPPLQEQLLLPNVNHPRHMLVPAS